MIGLNTNILVSYLAQDDTIQSPQATRIIEHQLSEGRPGFISIVTKIETVWVLDRVHRSQNRSGVLFGRDHWSARRISGMHRYAHVS